MNTRSVGVVPAALIAGAVMVSSGGCGGTMAEPQYAGRAAPYFRVQATPGPNRRGAPTVNGYISNDYGYNAGHIDLLVEALDDRGQVVAKRVVPFLGIGQPFSRGYFDVPAPAAGASYRVSVYWFEWIARGV